VGEGPDDRLTFDLLAASIRADAADLGLFLDVLAGRLEGALPADLVEVRRERGPFRRRHPVRSLAVTLGGRRYELHRQGHRLRASVALRAHGITLRTDEAPIDEWIDLLSRDLAGHAQASADARDALSRLIE
jgi:hypothetical protein